MVGGDGILPGAMPWDAALLKERLDKDPRDMDSMVKVFCGRGARVRARGPLGRGRGAAAGTGLTGLQGRNHPVVVSAKMYHPHVQQLLCLGS